MTSSTRWHVQVIFNSSSITIFIKKLNFFFFHFHILSKNFPRNIISHIFNQYDTINFFILVPEIATCVEYAVIGQLTGTTRWLFTSFSSAYLKSYPLLIWALNSLIFKCAQCDKQVVFIELICKISSPGWSSLDYSGSTYLLLISVATHQLLHVKSIISTTLSWEL